MARYLFDGGELIFGADGLVAPGHPFTVWTERVGGEDVTSLMRAPDAVSTVTVQSDADGEAPYLRGPDGVKGPLYRDAGSDTRSAWYSAEALNEALNSIQLLLDYMAANPSGPGGGVSAHGELSGLGADDHAHYLTSDRGDSRYYRRTDVDALVAAAAIAQSPADRDRGNHTGVQPITSVTDLEARLTGIVGVGPVGSRPSIPRAGYRYFATDLGLIGLDMVWVGNAWKATSELVLPTGAAVPVGTPTGTVIRRITSPIWAQTDFLGGDLGEAVTAIREPIFSAAAGVMTYAAGADGGQAAQVAGVNGSLTLPLGGRTHVRVGCYVSTAGGGAVPSTSHYLFTFRAGTTNVCDAVIRSGANLRRVAARQNFTYPAVQHTAEAIDDGDRWWVEAHLDGTTFNLEVWTEDNLTPGSPPDYIIGPLTTTVGGVDNVQVGNSAASGLTLKHEKLRASDGTQMGPQ